MGHYAEEIFSRGPGASGTAVPGAVHEYPTRWAARSAGSGMRTVGSTALVRSGDSCTAKAFLSQSARSSSEGPCGVVCGRKKRTTVPADRPAQGALDRVRRHFVASRPDELWVADFTYVVTWMGFVYVAFVIDVFADRISRFMQTDLVLDSLEQALHARHVSKGLIHHGDPGVQYLSICYSERLRDAGAEASVGTTGDSYDNAMAETIIRLVKTDLVHARGPWRSLDALEYATLEWMD